MSEVEPLSPTQDVAVASKTPPPETVGGQRTRFRVIAAFWAIVILFGIPTWLWTTSIYRARLPLDQMRSWAEGKACKPSFPVQIAVEAPNIPHAEALRLVQSVQSTLDDHNEFTAHHLRLKVTDTGHPDQGQNASTPLDGSVTRHWSATTHKSDEATHPLVIRLTADEEAITPQGAIQPHSTVLEIRYAPSQIQSPSSSTAHLSKYLASQLEQIFAEERAILQFLLKSGPSPSSSSAGSSSLGSRDGKMRQSDSLSADMIAKLSQRSNRSLKYASTYHLTFSLFTPSASPSNWDIEAAVQKYLEPLLLQLSVVSEFKVDTQVQLYAKFAPSTPAPEYDAEANVWTMRNEDLSSFINAAEWPLSPSIGVGPTLNFILYVPDSSTSPLVVKESFATDWLIPQFGGVVILNPDNTTSLTDVLSDGQLQPILLTFSQQLLSLLGAPQSPASLPLQLQTLIRVQAASLLLSASSTMGSLARLTVALPSIAIPLTVSTATDQALRLLQETCDALRAGQFSGALQRARIAEDFAEKGFFEKSMVGQVYFPDEHKVAVYLPLLGPIGVPLLMSAIKEIRKLLAARQFRRRAQ